MIKTIKIPSIRILKLILFFTFFIGLFITLYTFLYTGIKLERFNLAGSQIEGFYLRLDKKLILEIQSLHLKQFNTNDSSNQHSISTQVTFAKNIHFLLQYFEKINIKNIHIEDYQANLFYDGDNFTLNLPEFYVKINLTEDTSKLLIQIHDFYLKPYGIYYQGQGVYDLKRQEIMLNGGLDFLNKESHYSYVHLDLNVFSDLKTLNIKGSSNVFSDIKFLKPLLPEIKNKLIEAWIFDNYSVENVQINDFSITIPLGSKHIVEDSINSLYVLATAKNTAVIFHPNLLAAHAKSVKLLFQNNALEFYPESPTYKQYQADGTTIAIRNITSKAPSLEINLNTTAPLDSNIQEVLKAYNITLPLKAPKANITTKLFMHLDLFTHALQAKGFFKAKDSEISLSGVPLKFEDLNITLENHIIKVKSKNIIYQKTLQGDSNFIINTENKNISGDILIHSLILVEPDVLQISNHSLPFSINFKDENAIFLTLPTLALNATLNAPYTIDIENLSHFVPFSKILQDYKITKGTLKLNTQNFLEYQAKISINSAQNILMHKNNNTPLSTLHIDLSYTPNGLTLTSDVFSLTNTQNTQKISFKNINLNLNNENLSNTNPKNTKIPTIIEGSNTNLIFKDYTILSDSFTFNLHDDTIKGTLKHKNGTADIYKRGIFITLDAREFGDTFLNTIARRKIFNKGRFFINANTNEKGVIIGEMKLFNASIDELNVLQNLMAFLDTIPSLLSLKPPGFNNEGYYLEEGSIYFGLNDKFLAIDTLHFKGSSIDIKGQGIIQLESKMIDFNAELITAKALSGIINKIPLVNYIVLGKDGTISTNFKINGTLDYPQIQTQTTQDILLSPFNILKRVITSPFEVFN
ncbi:AsmA-like C-terminal domain-containing protein [Helicobacter sp.]|uniref:YhdP family protein n=1 Tax=Helicobacter sp. TaxID=218 RepID=UPI0025C0F3F2|nr:AsmA-like C-terminal domain-containing protein [Helicobacter sp.]MCI5968753.1 AsmA-like C-terminal domain-containing protein [Helicobacter sp.]MDY2584577.1 AsmA-like C-terminal domain-containing protein [Helicobacter sp.]